MKLNIKHLGGGSVVSGSGAVGSHRGCQWGSPWAWDPTPEPWTL